MRNKQRHTRYYQVYKIVLTLFTLPLLFGKSSATIYKEPHFIKAGAAVSNITPFLGDEIVGDFNTPEAVHIHDDLYVRCLVLDDGETKLAFGVIDNVFIRKEVLDAAKQLASEKTTIPFEHIMLSATHTHSATSASGKGKLRVAWETGEPFDEYQMLVICRIADGMVRALNNLELARIGYGRVEIPTHVFNRRWKMKPGTKLPNPFGGEDKVRTNPGKENSNLLEAAGPTDPEVVFLAVESLNGRPIALLANYSLHYVGGVPKRHISADYFGVFASRISRLLHGDNQDPPFVAIMTNGTSGDINNINVKEPPIKYRPYEKMQIVANDIADSVFQAYKKIRFKTEIPISAGQKELVLRVRKPTKKMLERASIFTQLPREQHFHPNEHIYIERILDMEQNWPDSIAVDIQVFNIGDLAIGAVPFEMFAEAGLEIKQQSPFPATFVIGLANGGFGYLPTAEQYELGGYETWLGTNRVEKEASAKITKTLLDIMDNLKQNTRYR